MQITVNGETKNFDGMQSVAELACRLGLDRGKIAIERNLEIIPKSQHDSTELADGDNIEIIHFIGGGKASS